MITDGARDFYSPFLMHNFTPDDTFQANIKKACNRYLPIFEKVDKNLISYSLTYYIML